MVQASRSVTAVGERDALLAALEATLEATADGILAVDRQGRILHVNQQFGRLWGMPAALLETRDRDAMLAFSAAQCADPAAFRTLTAQAYANPAASTLDSVDLRDGRTLQRSSRPQQAGGQLIGRVWSLRDITELRRAEESLRQSEERFRILSDSAGEGVLINVEGRIVECNEAFARMLGVQRKQVIGMSAVECAAPESRADVIRHVQTNDPTPYEVLGLRRDGSKFPAEISGRTTQFQGKPARVATIRDLTFRKLAEAAKDQEVRQQAEIARLQAVNEFRTSFINNAAHELATPLTPIQLQVAALRRANHDPGREASFELVGRNFTRLQRIIKDLLDAARLQSDHLKVAPRRTDLGDLVRHVEQTFRLQAGEGGHRLRVALGHDAGRPALADPERTEQVLFNLVSNALKFTPPGGAIELATRDVAAGIEVSVADTGVGLTAAQAARLFQPYTQVHEAARPGSGLGLYISKGIVERQGGTITAQSDGPGKGSRFSFTVPHADA
ncbi:MAG: hypothetical protein QOG31_1771 [Thermoplasmata archaeon]|jgi:PAS domain S-box-containing protein|nr:hypothetical protein [Thermoplasmata archaeon]